MYSKRKYPNKLQFSIVHLNPRGVIAHYVWGPARKDNIESVNLFTQWTAPYVNEYNFKFAKILQLKRLLNHRNNDYLSRIKSNYFLCLNSSHKRSTKGTAEGYDLSIERALLRMNTPIQNGGPAWKEDLPDTYFKLNRGQFVKKRIVREYYSKGFKLCPYQDHDGQSNIRLILGRHYSHKMKRQVVFYAC